VNLKTPPGQPWTRRKIVFGFLALAILLPQTPAHAATCAVDISQTNQSIRGFGACSAWHNSAYPTQLATWYWDSAGMTGNNPNGIGLSLLRCHIPYDNSTSGGAITDAGEAAVMKQAAGLGVSQIWIAEWTPPPAYKANNLPTGSNNNNNFSGAASGAANAADTGYATYLVNYIKYANQQLAANGVTIMAVSPQNEPDWDTTYESCLWNAGQFSVFTQALHSALQTGGLTTQIMIPESFRDDKTLAATAMNDPTISGYLGVIGNHLYGITNNLVLSSTPYSLANSGFSHVTTQEMWETEMSDVSGAGNDTSMTSGLVIAGWVHACIVDANMNAYHHWWLYPSSGSTNESLIGSDNASTKKLWVLGNWSRFVRPGFYRAGATEVPTAGVSISSYKNSNSTPTTIVIVAINHNGSAQSMTFNFAGGTVSQETPWVTDGGNNLARQTTQTVTGNSFTYSLSATSVTTFVCVIGAVGPTATFTNTVPPTPTFTRTSTPIPGAFCMIDNFEDGNTANNWGGTWTTYGDANTTLAFSVPAGGAPGSTAFSGSCSGSVSNYGGITCPFGSTMDLSPYTGGVAFYAKGSGAYWFQMAIPAVTDGDNFGVSFTANAAWTPVTVLFSQLAQRGFGTAQTFSPSQVSMFQWANLAAGNYNLQLDDVRMLGANCAGSTPTSTPTLTFTATRSWTPTSTASGTPTFSPTQSSTPVSTSTSTLTPLPGTATSTRTWTPTSTPTRTPTSTSTLTPTPTGSTGNKAYCFTINRSAVNPLVNDLKLTLLVNVGTCSSVSVTADGASVPATYLSSTGQALFTTTGTTIQVTAVNWTSGGTGAATKATLYNNYHWAYSLTLDDGIQSQYDNAKPLLDAKGWKAGAAVVGSWTDGGGGGGRYMSWATIQALRAAGWQIYNHTFTHPNPVDCTNFVNEFGQDQTDLLSHLPGYHVSHIVYPYEVQTSASCAGFPPNFLISGEIGAGGGTNYVDATLPNVYLVQRNGLYGTGYAAWQTNAAAAAGNARPNWYISITHSVSAGTGAPTDQYATNADALGNLLNYLDTNYGNTGNKSMWFAPSGEVMDYIFTRDQSLVSACSGTPIPTPTNTPTQPPTSTFTRTATPIPGAFCMIDNFEDGNTANNWGGTWTTYGDANTTLAFSVPAGGAPGSTAFSGSCSGSVSNYGGITCPFGSTMDLSPYTGGVAFYAKGSGTYWFQMAIPAVTDGDNFGVSFTANAAWTPVTVLFSQLAQRGFGTAQTFSPSQVSMFQWANMAAGNYNLQLDDVRMLGATCPGTTPTFTFTPTRPWTQTPTATFTATSSPTMTATWSMTPTSTVTSTPTRTWTASPTATFSSTQTFTPTSTATPTATFTLTVTRTATASPTSTSTATWTATLTSTSTSTLTRTNTATATASPTSTFTSSPTVTSTRTSTSTFSPTSTPTASPTFTSTVTATSTASSTPSATRTLTPTASPTNTAQATSTFTSSPTSTPTRTSTSTSTPTSSPTNTSTPPPGATPTFTPTNTLSPTNSSTPTRTFTTTWTFTPTSTASFTATRTFTPTPSATGTVTSTSTFTSTASFTSSATRTPSPTSSPTPTYTLAFTATQTFTQTSTATRSSTPTASATAPPTNTSTPTPTGTPTSTSTATSTPTGTSTSTWSATPTFTATLTYSPTPTYTFTATLPPGTYTFTPAPTSTHTPTYTSTPSYTSTSTSTASLTRTFTPTLSPTPTDTNSPTDTRTSTPTSSRTDTPTPTATNTPSDTRTWTPTSTSTNSATRTATPSPTATPTPSTTPTSTKTSTPTPTDSPTSTPTPSKTATPTWSPSSTATPSFTPSATYTPTRTPIPTQTWTPTPTSSPTAPPTLTPTPSATLPVCPPVAISAAYPNPSYSLWIPVKVNLASPCPKTVDWKIVTVANRLVASGALEVSGTATVAWNQRDKWGRLVSDGIYYFLLNETGQPTRMTKIVILR